MIVRGTLLAGGPARRYALAVWREPPPGARLPEEGTVEKTADGGRHFSYRVTFDAEEIEGHPNGMVFTARRGDEEFTQE